MHTLIAGVWKTLCRSIYHYVGVHGAMEDPFFQNVLEAKFSEKLNQPRTRAP